MRSPRPNLFPIDLDLGVARSNVEIIPPGTAVGSWLVSAMTNTALVKLRNGSAANGISLLQGMGYTFPVPIRDGLYIDNVAQAGYSIQIAIGRAGSE